MEEEGRELLLVICNRFIDMRGIRIIKLAVSRNVLPFSLRLNVVGWEKGFFCDVYSDVGC